MAGGDGRIGYARSSFRRDHTAWLGEPDPVASMDASRAENPELSDIRELFGLWLVAR